MGPGHTRDNLIYKKGLGPRQVMLLAEWEREGRQVISLEELRAKVGQKVANDVARELVGKGALQRVRRGLYFVRPFRTFLHPTTPSTAVAASVLLQGQPHYLGGLWAAALHGLTEQRHSALIDAFVLRRLVARELGVGRVRFHVLPPDLFDYGVSPRQLEGFNVLVSDRERTLLDGLDHPRLFGGLSRTLEVLKTHLPKSHLPLLVTYAARGSKSSTCQRLGVLLERAGSSPSSLRTLRNKARQSRSLLSMNPDLPRKGRVNATWGVVENDE